MTAAQAGWGDPCRAVGFSGVTMSLWKRIRFWIVRIFLIGLIIASLPPLLIVAYRWVDPPLTVPILLEWVTGKQPRQNWVSLSEISPLLVAGATMSEDARFCRHNGVDWETLYAQVEAVQEGERARGASTISMQTTKNLFLWQSRSYTRKAVEIPLALWADWFLGKPRMIEIYLNVAEFGPSLYGAEAAAQAYFNKPAKALGRSEAARLATALPNPKSRNAGRPSRRHARLARTVERRIRQAEPWLDCLPDLKP
ncbi:MAG: biosynthetic peptidoglycan transglycosylase [Pseudomonadota bacterium]